MKKIIGIVFTTFLFAVDYETQIQPIFNNNCGNCHLGNSSGGVNLSSYINTMNSDVITPGNHEQSTLWDEINSGDMPQGNNPELSEEDIDLIAQWIDEGALPEENNDVSGCMDPNAITCDDDIDPLYFPECNTCSEDIACENYYNSDATVDNGLCMYNDVPASDDFTIEADNTGFYLDWSTFTPPVAITQYVLMRCADVDGDTDGDGYLEYENCVMIIQPMSGFLDMQYYDIYDLSDDGGIKYTLSVHYPNNNYWGSAFGNYYYESDGVEIELGDLNFDGIVNIIDIVTMVNGILSAGFTEDQMQAADLNGDGIVNVIDIVSLVNLILSP